MKAVKASLLYDGLGNVLRDVYVVFDRDIVDVTKEKPKEAEIIAEGVVTPAFIDGHSHIGMDRYGEPYQEGEANEQMDAVLPLVDALYSIYMDDKAFKHSIEFGVLYSSVLPGSGNIIGGKAVFIRNYGRDIEDAFIKYAGVKAAFGYNPRSTTSWKGTRPSTRMGAIGILLSWLIKTQKTIALLEKGKKEPEEVEPTVEALIPVLKGEVPLRVHVHKEDDIAALLMIKRKFGLKITIEHAGDVHSRETFEKIKAEGVPVIYGPFDAHPYKVELKHEDWKNARYLLEVRPLFGLMSDHPVTLQANLYLQLRHFIRLGMSREEAIKVITNNNAKILGVDDKLGSVERGKWASLVVWNGDPFHLENYPTHVFAEGELIHEADW
ncbi:amidohydrolase [Thermococcus barossii]|uniref:Imidazolonepropionase n=1 Tax=Thermococcus barossii TaxID=54077 RepID=A0A2Z2MFD3_9EURY|nr:amidohydrolase [Thermococcus barossii]ASJ04626.1 imidazolonepropionase [Thermococcus barossii]